MVTVFFKKRNKNYKKRNILSKILTTGSNMGMLQLKD